MATDALVALLLMLLADVCSGSPLPKRALQKRASPLINNPGATAVFVIAVIICFTIIIWAFRKHYQQKYEIGLHRKPKFNV